MVTFCKDKDLSDPETFALLDTQKCLRTKYFLLSSIHRYIYTHTIYTTTLDAAYYESLRVPTVRKRFTGLPTVVHVLI